MLFRSGDIQLHNSLDLPIESVRIFDVQGQCVARYAHTGILDTSGLVPGIYLLKVRMENGQETTLRLIRQ